MSLYQTAQKIADPLDYPDQFEDLTLCQSLEEFIKKKRETLKDVPAHQYSELKEFLSTDLFKVLKEDKNADLNSIGFDFEVLPENPLFEKLNINEQGEPL